MFEINFFMLLGSILLTLIGCVFAWYAADIGLTGIIGAIEQRLCKLCWHSWSKVFVHTYCFGRARLHDKVISYEILNRKCKHCPKTKFAGRLVND